ncbi:MAG: HlyD family type I secretion periplasmic adaptor subunit [Desulfobacteraceae bacterium]|nr:HlyD family type I secretion periplasmic adaptor subunit [Desulfobacteraceae bacterium]
MINKNTYSSDDLKFMDSLNAAILVKSPVKLYLLLYIVTSLILLLIIWANFAEIDELTRGIGKVIPSHKIQIIQNLEGGIVDKILIREGEFVKKGQVLLHIDDTGAGSSFQENYGRINELKARAIRLRAEAGITAFSPDKISIEQFPNIIKEEERLYNTNVRRKQSEKEILAQRLKQKQLGLSKTTLNIRQLNASKKMIQREIELTEPLFLKRLISEVEYLQLKQKKLQNQRELDEAKSERSSYRSQIVEAENMIKELEAKQQGEAQQQLGEVVAEIDRISSFQVAIEDRVERTIVRSPVDGTVKQLLINTVGGVVAPGMDILEIVPTDDKLLIEAKIKPSDIAFIYPGQKTVLKFTAYDFAIYGGIDGEVVHISADTITDNRQEEFYLVRIKANKDFIGQKENKKKIIVGMTVQTDIITGKKTIMQYLMKPILRAKHNALRER